MRLISRTAGLCSLLVLLPALGCSPGTPANDDAGSVPRSADPSPHFELIDGRQVFHVDGWPFTVLAVEIPWWDLLHGKEKETQSAYDFLYPAARSLGLNTLKVPVKWSLVEPEKGRFDFRYVDHVKRMAELHGLKLVLCWFGHYASNDGTIYINLTGDLFAPMDIVLDDSTYPRAIDADGLAHHNSASYEYDPIIDRETAAFRAFMAHIRRVDAETRTILMVQIENEIAAFGWDRQNRKFWRDHSPVSDSLFAACGFSDDLRYTAWRFSSNWIRRITDAGAREYPLPFFLNFVGGKLADWMVGGAPGEDVAVYLDNCPSISFVGLNFYPPGGSSLNDFRSALSAYRVGRNLPSITETNSDLSPVAPRLAFMAIGEFGSPIFAPWALNNSTPTSFQPYVLPDGSLANGASALRDCYRSLGKAISQISTHAGTPRLRVFLSDTPWQPFSETKEVAGARVKVSSSVDGQVMVIRPKPNEFLVVGYRCHVSIYDSVVAWPAIRRIKVERGYWVADRWNKEGEANYYGLDLSEKSINLEVEVPQAVRISW
jgi:hypothetical protein